MELTWYHGRWLTEAEILLSKEFERRHEEHASELRAKQEERKYMAQRSLRLQQTSELSSAPKKAAPPPAPVPEAKVEPKSEPKVDKSKKKPEEIASWEAKGRAASTETVPSEEPEAEQPRIPAQILSKPAKIIKKRETLEEDDAMDVVLDPQDLFSPEGMLSDKVWKSNAPSAESQVFMLPGFGYNQKQTLGLRLTVPNDAKSWSFNICPARDYDNNNIFLHFNPRYHKKTVVMTDKQGTWGAGKSRHFAQGATSKTDGLLAKDIDLMVQIRNDGFYIWANGMYNCFFTHRRNPAIACVADPSEEQTDLKLIVNARDANGKPLDLILNKVWWGRRDPQRDPLPAGVQGRIDRTVTEDRNQLARAVPFSERSLMIRGLPLDQYDLVECQAIEFALTEVFSEWVVEDTSVVPGKGYGFIRFATADVVDAAIQELDGAEIVLSEKKGDDGEDAGGSVLKLTRMLL